MKTYNICFFMQKVIDSGERYGFVPKEKKFKADDLKPVIIFSPIPCTSPILGRCFVSLLFPLSNLIPDALCQPSCLCNMAFVIRTVTGSNCNKKSAPLGHIKMFTGKWNFFREQETKTRYLPLIYGYLTVNTKSVSNCRCTR